MSLCAKQYSASSSGHSMSSIGFLTVVCSIFGLLILGSSTLGFSSSVIICLISSSLSLEELSLSGSGSGIRMPNLGRLTVLLVNGI